MTSLTIAIPGPVNLRDALKRPELHAAFGHRDSAAHELYQRISQRLLTIAGTTRDEYDCLLINGSGTNAMEACVRSLIRDDGSSTFLTVGAFGELFAKIAQGCDKANHGLVQFEAGTAIDLTTLAQDEQVARAEILVFTHNESSTGVTNDLAVICAWAAQQGKQVIVDGVSLFAGAPVNLSQTKPLAYITATQKCLGLPAGLSIVFLRKDVARQVIEQVPNRGYTTDLKRYLTAAGKHEVLTTPNCSLWNQLDAQLDYITQIEGIENRFARHQQLQAQVLAWITQQGLSLYPALADASPSVSAIRVPADFDLAGLKQRMREQGYLMDVGYAGLNQELIQKYQYKTFRIPHMADMTAEGLDAFLRELEQQMAN
ncbi:pyridoxal-phosphate-dependent aminotransferase family protein [Aquirhabdus parva]|uniref:Alanine--glyoxylate aminotransferase family protein n=1 Tax=Aquirhabdus parva TaxID=2283318 RepID=A0A345P9V3_9GAMM|nr:aminotransferase class V-fold PLP-dependent enzyme [Aquirhabdus parva]AXI04062.1 alanine--glyoxylate aminotransferase family protein [Aquirhabdus parva]